MLPVCTAIIVRCNDQPPYRLTHGLLKSGLTIAPVCEADLTVNGPPPTSVQIPAAVNFVEDGAHALSIESTSLVGVTAHAQHANRLAI